MRIKPILLLLGSVLLVLGVLWVCQSIILMHQMAIPAPGTVVIRTGNEMIKLVVGCAAILVGAIDLVYAMRNPGR